MPTPASQPEPDLAALRAGAPTLPTTGAAARMDARDEATILRSLSADIGRAEYLYRYEDEDGGEGLAISSAGARQLATRHGHLVHRVLGYVDKTGDRLVLRSYGHGATPADYRVQFVPAMGDEPDFHAVHGELTDTQTGLTVADEQVEPKTRPGPDGTPQRRANVEKIARAKLFRNLVLQVVPQTTVQAFRRAAMEAHHVLDIERDPAPAALSGYARAPEAGAVGEAGSMPPYPGPPYRGEDSEGEDDAAAAAAPPDEVAKPPPPATPPRRRSRPSPRKPAPGFEMGD